MDKRQVCDLALQALEDTESMRPCEAMAEDPGGWCEKHCRPEYPAARKECWREFLEKEYVRKWAEVVKQGADR